MSNEFEVKGLPTWSQLTGGIELARVDPDGLVTIHWEQVEQCASDEASMLNALAKILIAARGHGRAAIAKATGATHE